MVESKLELDFSLVDFVTSQKPKFGDDVYHASQLVEGAVFNNHVITERRNTSEGIKLKTLGRYYGICEPLKITEFDKRHAPIWEDHYLVKSFLGFFPRFQGLDTHILRFSRPGEREYVEKDALLRQHNL